jgi:hypothetical protein
VGVNAVAAFERALAIRNASFTPLGWFAPGPPGSGAA